MNKQNLLTLTLIISGLALNPAMAEVRVDTESTNPTQSQQQNSNSVRAGISSVLYNRGLDEDVAEELASNMVEEENEMFLAMLLQALERHNIASREDVLAYLSNAALHRETIDFKKYDNLVGMVSKIQKKALDGHTLKQLSYLSNINKQLFV